MNDLKKIKFEQFLYYFAWFIGLFRLINPKIYRSIPNAEIFTLIQIIFLFVCIILKKYPKTQFLKFFLLGLLLGISAIISQNYDALLIFMLVIAFRNENFDNMVKFDIKIKFLLLLFNVILIYFGIIDNTVFLKNGLPRYTLGFYSTNSFPAFLSSVIIEIVYLSKKYKFVHFILIFIIVLLIDLFFCSRTSEIILLFFSILMLFKNNKLISKIMLNRTLKYLPFILTILSFSAVNLYEKGNNIFIKINEILTTRLYCASQYLKLYNINLWGNKIVIFDKYIGYAQTIDISYINFLLQNGIVSYIIIFFLIFKLLNKLVRNENINLLIIFITFLLMGLVEKTALYVSSNIFLLLIANLFESEKDRV